MTHQRITRHCRAALGDRPDRLRPRPAALAASPATAAPAPAVSCASDRAGLAAKLTKDITAALKGHRSTTALAVQDHRTRTSCTLRPTQHVDSASVVKVTVLAALLWDAQKADRPLTPREERARHGHDHQVGQRRDHRAVGLARPREGQGVHQGGGHDPYGAGRRGRMGAHPDHRPRRTASADPGDGQEQGPRRQLAVPSSWSGCARSCRQQRWGVPAGAPGDATVQLKNGWLERSTHGWRVHSVGAFSGRGHDYVITVLTQDNKTMEDGVDTIQAVSKAVHKDIGPARPLQGFRLRCPARAAVLGPPVLRFRPSAENCCGRMKSAAGRVGDMR